MTTDIGSGSFDFLKFFFEAVVELFFGGQFRSARRCLVGSPEFFFFQTKPKFISARCTAS